MNAALPPAVTAGGFGFRLSAPDVDLPELPRRDDDASLPLLEVACAPIDDDALEGTLILDVALEEDEEPTLQFVRLPSGSYGVRSAEFGRYLVDAGTMTVTCDVAWCEKRWQDLFIAQVLPLAAVVLGYEPLHAAGVVLADGATVIAAESGTGKTTLAAHLLVRGGALLSDDVVSLQLTEDSIVAYAGSCHLQLDAAQAQALGAMDTYGGRTVGEREGKTTHALPGDVVSETLRRVVLLGRDADLDGVRVARLDPVPPTLLLASSFNLSVQTPTRLIHQLDVCQRLATSVEVVQVEFGPNVGPAALASTLLERWAT